MTIDAQNISIRPIAAADIESMVDCVNAVFLERLYLAYVEPQERANSVAYFASGIADGFPRVVAINGDTVVGWCDVTPAASERAMAQRHVGRLGMGLLPPYRGMGLGRQLISQCLNGCHGKWERIELGVYSHNERAHKLYLRCGFIEEGRRRGAWKLDGMTSDIIEMALFV